MTGKIYGRTGSLYWPHRGLQYCGRLLAPSSRDRVLHIDHAPCSAKPAEVFEEAGQVQTRPEEGGRKSGAAAKSSSDGWPRMNREQEVQPVSEADHHIAVAERAATKQMLELEKFHRDGHDTALAEKVLKGYEHSLQVLKDHRANIVRFIEQIDQGLA